MTFLTAIRLAYKFLGGTAAGRYVMQYRTVEERLAMKTLIRRKFGLSGLNRVAFYDRSRIDSFSPYERAQEREREHQQRSELLDRVTNRRTFNSSGRQPIYTLGSIEPVGWLNNLCSEITVDQGSLRGAASTMHVASMHADIDSD